MVNVIIGNVIMVYVIMVNVIMVNIFMVNVFMVNIFMVNVFMVNVGKRWDVRLFLFRLMFCSTRIMFDNKKIGRF